MERKFEIPKMSNEDIVRLARTIKPIVRDDKNRCRYLRRLSDEELTFVAFTWLDKPKDFADRVDYSRLAVLVDIKMYLSFGYRGLFKPRVDEVIRQIPQELIDRVVAFEIVDSSIGLNSRYADALKEHCRVSIVRLYESKNGTNQQAQQIKEYPTSNSPIPRGMTEEEFRTLYKHQ